MFISQVDPRLCRCHLQQEWKKKAKQEQDKRSHVCSHHSTRFLAFLSFHFTFILSVSCGRWLNSPTASRRKDVDWGMILLHGAACGSAAGERRILSLFFLFSSCSSSYELCTITVGTVLFCTTGVLVLNSIALLMNQLAKRLAAVQDYHSNQ